MGFNWDVIVEYLPFFWEGTLLTIALSLAGIVLGTIIGLFIGLGKMQSNKWLALPFVWYINFFRGTPLFVQILLIHFGVVPYFIGETNPIAAAIIALSLNAAAYIAEIFRAGIQSIDKGQMEASRSLGMTHVQAMRYVILPQAIKRMIPPLGNEFVVLIKESSIAAIIATPEIMYWSRAMNGQYYIVWEPYLMAAFIYLILTLSLSAVLNRIERRLTTG
ncbi:amino acid ABC transporter permease [Gottfriedia solisilvae]|uniref:Amino acid ABC transporter permease n=1 Tax=Gottfriedia solisilvae TaxID=1516104 RepID=A0A8J3AKU5_9BACI|nr:amino acid ABC transporter permease [Gottfriedia solisilvae]GGI12551.1 amino acid ABC transporter permease [Gottfriedia solisilvae]